MKTAIITISKNNDKYLDEWISYHLNIGFDAIFFCDNNDIDNLSQKNIIDKYELCKYIDIKGVKLDNSSSIGKLQSIYFTKLFNEHKHDFDWFLFIDVDEFLFTSMPLKDFLSQECFNDTNEIILNWKCFDDNDLVLYDDRPVQERFTRPYTNNQRYTQTFPENEVCKCFLSNKAKIIEHKVHVVTISNGKVKNACGNIIDVNWRQSPIIHQNAYIKHYETKTLDEYIQCRLISKRCTLHEIMHRIHCFFNVNKHTEEKDYIVNFLLNKFK